MVAIYLCKYDVEWSWEKNKKFELALVEVNEDKPDRWDKIAKIVGGKSSKEIEEHYKSLVHDLNLIESGVSFDEYSDVVESQKFRKLVTTADAAPLGLCLKDENGTSMLELRHRLDDD